MLSRLRRLEFSDNFSLGFLLVSVISEYLFEIFVVLPVSKEGLIRHEIHMVLGTYVFVNIMLSLILTMRTDTTTRRVMLPTLLKPAWHYCPSCEENSPPRAFHCDKCKTCVLRRDHHCPFACCCIGHRNFRFYLSFLFFLSIGCLYASMFNMGFIWDLLGGFSTFAFFAHLLPFVFWVTGYLSFRVFLCTLLSVLALVGFVCVLNLFVIHFRNMLRNQTTFEGRNRMDWYDFGWRRNVTEWLGTNWKFVWISPVVSSPLPGDGLSYPDNRDTFSKFKLGNNLHDCGVRQRL